MIFEVSEQPECGMTFFLDNREEIADTNMCAWELADTIGALALNPLSPRDHGDIVAAIHDRRLMPQPKGAEYDRDY